ncbi:MAG: vitamin K epoxide reductase family protein [Bacteroidota bacterium]
MSHFLISNGYKIDYNELIVELLSHPDLYSFQSFTDTLNRFGISNMAVSMPKSEFKNVGGSVLVSLNIDGRTNMAVAHPLENNQVQLRLENRHTTDSTLPFDEFVNLWDGFIIAIEPNPTKSKLKVKPALLLLFVLNVGVAINIVSYGFDILIVLFTFLSITGLTLSYYIYRATYEPDAVPLKFCTLSHSTDCSSVLKSTGPKLFGRFNMSDLTLIYFSVLYLAMMLNIHTQNLLWVCLLSLFAVVYSLYQQVFIVKRWCSLCLAVCLVLLLQFFIVVNSAPLIPNIQSIVSLTFAFTLVSIIWWALKPVIESHVDNTTLKKKLRSFQRNYHLFTPYFHTLPFYNTNIECLDILIGGNNDASIKILGVTNPLCAICFEVFEMYQRLIAKYPDDVQVSLRFYLPNHNPNDPRVLVAASMIKAFEDKSPDIFNSLISNWHKSKDLNIWMDDDSPKIESKYLKILKSHRDWCEQNKVDVTPTIIVNNKRFPMIYSPLDLENMMERLIEIEKTKVDKIPLKSA